MKKQTGGRLGFAFDSTHGNKVKAMPTPHSQSLTNGWDMRSDMKKMTAQVDATKKTISDTINTIKSRAGIGGY